MQNGLPFHHGHLTPNNALSGKPLRAVDPSGTLFESFHRHQVVSGVCYIAAERTGPAEVTCRSTPKVTKFMFGAVAAKVPECFREPCMHMSEALNGVVEGLLASGVQATIVRPPSSSEPCQWAVVRVSADSSATGTSSALTG